MSQAGVTLRTTRDKLLVFLGDDTDFAALLQRLSIDLRDSDTRAGCTEALVDIGKRVISGDQLEQLGHVLEQGGLRLSRIVDSIDMASRPSWWPASGGWVSDDEEDAALSEISASEDAGHEYTVVHAPESEPPEVLLREVIWRRDADSMRDEAEGDQGVSSPEPNAYLHKSTLRSGQAIVFAGDVIVMGDVNSGAEVISSGDVVVMGTLRGVAHAGSGGDPDATVSAFRLEASQLRISDIVARAPDGERLRPKRPEIARIHDGAVVIESLERHLPNRSKGGKVE